MAFFTATTLAAASLGLAAIGTGLSFYGQMQAAESAKEMGKYNAQLAEQQALQTEMDSRESVKRRRQENQRFLATQRTAYAKSGVTIEGSPLEVMGETAGILELEALDANRQAQQQASAYRAQGAYDRMVGKTQAQGYRIGAGASLLSGLASTVNAGVTYRKQGIF